ncbi:anti-sigma-K factor RskA [Nocardia tenerifensis]|uniref:Regulator of SigK n=1 Tax=Nocardia tenerifensis TaxID=228006 RepID=A0A318KHX6_9NOCA|nr:anti-sigma factor [Nocardia tenerifensis]PXX60267.1 anti-sigma-K factor RskA [Nocardia tenerifensis]
MTSEPHNRTGAYVLDALPVDERADFERHLTDCAGCRSEVAEMSEAPGRSAGAVPADGMKEGVRADLHKRAAEDALGVTQLMPALNTLGRTDIMPALKGLPDNDSPAHSRRWTWWTAAGVAATAAALLAGLTLVGGEHNGEADQVRAARDAITRDGVVMAGDGVAEAVSSASIGKTVVMANGLPTPDEDHGYQLWSLPADGTPRSAGMMHVSGGRAELSTNLPGDTVLLAITAEPSRGSDQPTTPMVARIPLS